MRLAILLLALTVPVLAQSNTCGGLTSVKDTRPPVYQPIARAAHVEGNVILMVSFETNGEVSHVEVVSGPEVLRPATMDYVREWQANTYSGPRNCQVVIRYKLLKEGAKNPTPVLRADPQHVTVTATAPHVNVENSY